MNATNNQYILFDKSFLLPKYWGVWFGYGILRLISFLPYKAKIRLGESLGQLLFHIAKSRKKIAHQNLLVAFPDKSSEEINYLLYEHFKSLGISIIEFTITTWGKHRYSPNDNESKYFSYHGLEHLTNLQDQGALILVPHFTTMEMSGLILSFAVEFHPIYRKHDNSLIEYLITSHRNVAIQNPNQKQILPIANTDTKTILKTLREHKFVWIAPDQKYTSKGSINVPFFDVNAPSHSGLSKIAKLGHACVVPCFTRRIGYNYEMHFLPPLENFPSGDDFQDALNIHHLYENEIRQNPSQYLWVHDRWDSRNHNPDFMAALEKHKS